MSSDKETGVAALKSGDFQTAIASLEAAVRAAPSDYDAQVYLASAHRNLRLFGELRQILRAFNAAGLSVIPLKGACLAEMIYGNIALRPMVDVDLLLGS